MTTLQETECDNCKATITVHKTNRGSLKLRCNCEQEVNARVDRLLPEGWS